MAVLHIYTKNGKIYCTAKEPFLGKEKPLPNLPAFSELFSSGVTCVVFKLPSLLKTRNFKLICFALLSFVLRKYYRQKIPKLLDSFLNKQKEKDLFFIGGSVGAELIKFHYAKKNDVVVEGVETINLIAKSNKALNRLISQVKPKEVKKRIFIVGLFSPELLQYLRKKYPLANIEVRYFDILRPSRIKEFTWIKNFSLSNDIKISVYDQSTSSKFGIPYAMNKVNTSKLINFLNVKKKYDVCFLAAYSLDREKSLRPLLSALKKANLNVKILLVDYPYSELEDFKVDREIVSYENYLRLMSESRAVIDLWRLAPGEGYSFRISEALTLNSKIITNRTCILNEPFYDASRMFVFSEGNEINPDAIKHFLISPMKPVDKSIFSLGTN